ncbi:MAG: DUF692 domain-containing protein [Gammaproteobacteria bacterium]|nr:DUF692 domain-containing protein [Gammaproteobacteria bacterium]
MSKNKTPTRPYLGFGLGLRTDHYDAVIKQKPDVDWFEIISENYMVPGGKPLYYLDKIRQDYPMVMHGVSMSLGSSDPLNQAYLKDLKALIKRVEPQWVSDHLCWGGVHGKNLHDLLPLPYNEDTIAYVADRINQVQDTLGRQILIENVSSYVSYTASTMSEWEFLATLTERADCLILLDINNIYVSAFNHEFDALEYLNAIPIERVQQFHLAGHQNNGHYIVDTHDHPVIDPVWELYAHAVRRFGAVSTMIERDDNIPPLEALLTELDHARSIAKPILEESVA